MDNEIVESVAADSLTAAVAATAAVEAAQDAQTANIDAQIAAAEVNADTVVTAAENAVALANASAAMAEADAAMATQAAAAVIVETVESEKWQTEAIETLTSAVAMLESNQESMRLGMIELANQVSQLSIPPSSTASTESPGETPPTIAPESVPPNPEETKTEASLKSEEESRGNKAREKLRRVLRFL